MKMRKEYFLYLFKIFNFLGATLVFFGLFFLISANWYSLNSFFKIFSTLGAAVAADLIGCLLYLEKKHEIAGSAFFMLAGLLLPIGLYVTFDVFHLTQNSDAVNVIISLVGLSLFLFSHWFYPRTIFLLFTILFASLFFISLINFITHQANVAFHHLLEYELLVLGCSYLCLGRYLDLDKKFPLSGPLYFLGSFYTLSASYSLGGLYCNELGGGIALWKGITAMLIFSTFMLAIPLRSRALLYVAAFFLVFYLIDMSSKFIALFGSYSWPLMLILFGFLLMFAGYLVFYLRQRSTHKKTLSQ